MQENASLKEQFEFSEKLEDIEKFKEQLQERDAKIKALSEELGTKASILVYSDSIYP